ncbi:MAG: hypothetical protein ACRDST_13590, partial [Pseudonocardiaceae bacterium]
TWYAGVSQHGGSGPNSTEHRGAEHGRADRRATDQNLRAAMDSVLTSMARNAPLTWTARMLPRSVLPRAWRRQDG